MAAEAQRAPRVARGRSSLAATFEAAVANDTEMARVDAALAMLNAFEINGSTPFDLAAEDLVTNCLDQAHALTIALSNATDVPDGDAIIRNIHVSRCIDAIGTLISLAAFARRGDNS